MGSSKSAPAPVADPAIGQAAIQQAQLGREYLDFQKAQFAQSEARLAGEQGMYKQVLDSQMATQQRADQWAQEDRAAGTAAKDQFDILADQSQALGLGYMMKSDRMADQFGALSDQQNAFGSSQQGRYNGTFAPIEDRMAKDAMEWDSDARLESEAAKARAQVTDSAAAQEMAGQRQMASMGVNPNSGRFASAVRSNGLQTALAQAGAQNVTRDAVRGQAQAMRGQAVGIGQNVLASGQQAIGMGLQAAGAKQGALQSAYNMGSSGIAQGAQIRGAGLSAMSGGLSAASLGLSAGSSAVGTTGAQNNGYLASNGLMTQGYSGAQQGVAGSAATLNNLYGNQLNSWNAQNQAAATNSAGIGSLVGSVVGAGATLGGAFIL